MEEHLLYDVLVKKDNPNQGLKKLINTLKPEWKFKEVKLKALNEGDAGTIYKCFSKISLEDAGFTIRVGYKKDVLHLDEKKIELEKRMIVALSRSGHLPKLKVVFGNGCIHENIQGRIVFNTKEKTGEMNNEMLRQFVSILIHVHNLNLNYVNYNTDYFDTRLSKLTLRKVVQHERLPSNIILSGEFQFLYRYMKSVRCPIRLCQGDPNPKFMIWNEEEEKLTLMDWRNVYVGRIYFDIAQFCAEMQLLQELQLVSSNVIFPENWENVFLHLYYNEWMIKLEKEYNVDEFNEFTDEIKRCEMVHWLFLIFVACMLPEVAESIAGDRFKLYEFCSKKYLAIKEDFTENGKFEINFGR